MRSKTPMIVTGLVLGVLALVLASMLAVLAFRESRGESDDAPAADSGTSDTDTGDTDDSEDSGDSDDSEAPDPEAIDPDDAALDVAISNPVEDSYYPEQGDPGIDTLHYGLDLTWEPDGRTLTGIADVALRATTDADTIRLDLLDALEVSEVLVDGEPAEYEQSNDDLVVTTDVEADERYSVRISYSGTPTPVDAPTIRSDLNTTGLTTTSEGEIWTMQEPYGAYTWYPVNDQPEDKALYDFTIRAPRDWVGVANGVLESREVEDGKTVTQWHLSSPAASYLTTIAVGDFVETTATSSSGVPISYWTDKDDPSTLAKLKITPKVMDFNEKYLGPYPFDSLGIVVVDSTSGMETQTMITLGTTDYTLSSSVIQHELTHQWYGDQIGPTDWRDVWMNEGMTMFMQGVWEADQEGITIDAKFDQWASTEATTRQMSGPPGDYNPDHFGEGNIYYGPATMWNELRHRIGDDAFWQLVRDWPSVYGNTGDAATDGGDGTATRDEYLDWVEKETGEELTDFFDAWLMGKNTPETTR